MKTDRFRGNDGFQRAALERRLPFGIERDCGRAFDGDLRAAVEGDFREAAHQLDPLTAPQIVAQNDNLENNF